VDYKDVLVGMGDWRVLVERDDLVDSKGTQERNAKVAWLVPIPLLVLEVDMEKAAGEGKESFSKHAPVLAPIEELVDHRVPNATLPLQPMFDTKRFPSSPVFPKKTPNIPEAPTDPLSPPAHSPQTDTSCYPPR
jgi:hypothetical protein